MRRKGLIDGIKSRRIQKDGIKSANKGIGLESLFFRD